MRYRLDRNSIVLSRSAFDYYKKTSFYLENVICQDHKIKNMVMGFFRHSNRTKPDWITN